MEVRKGLGYTIFNGVALLFVIRRVQTVKKTKKSGSDMWLCRAWLTLSSGDFWHRVLGSLIACSCDNMMCTILTES